MRFRLLPLILVVALVGPSAALAQTAAEQVFALTNAERQKVGLKALAWDTRIAAAAQKFAEDMKARNYYSHTGQDGSLPWDRMAREGYRGAAMGENIARGFTTPSMAVSAWMGSPGHRANILNAAYDATGVGQAGTIWVQDFGGGGTPAPGPPPAPPPPPPVPTGAVYHVSPSGSDSAPGTSAAPWRTIAKANATLRAGQTVLIHAGTYREGIAPSASGSAGAPIVYRAAGDGPAILDGGSGRISGWTLEGGGVYRRAWSGACYGVFQDDFAVAGKHTILWQADVSVYDGNPSLDITRPSMWKLAGGVLRVRTRDNQSPDAHNVRAALLRAGVAIDGRSYITVQGLTFRDWRNFADVNHAAGVVLDGCDMQCASMTGIWLQNSTGCAITNCKLLGGGSYLGHYEDSIDCKVGSGHTIANNEIGWGGHSGFIALPITDLRLTGNRIHDCGGTAVIVKRQSDRALIDGNRLERCGQAADLWVHPVPHAAIQLIGDGGTVSNNTIWACGSGIQLSIADGCHCNGNLIRNNTVAWVDELGCVLEGYAATSQGSLNANRFERNIFGHAALRLLRLDLPGGEGGDFWGNRFTGNDFHAGDIQYWNSYGSVLDGQARWPVVFSGNSNVDPLFVAESSGDLRLAAGSPCAGLGAQATAPAPPPVPPPAPNPPPAPPPPPTPPPASNVPALEAISPASGPPRTRVVLTGKNFGPSGFVIWSTQDGQGLRVTPLSWSDGRAESVAPPTVASGPVYVRRVDDQGSRVSNTVRFEVTR